MNCDKYLFLGSSTAGEAPHDKYLFLGANTADGFVGFFDRIIDMYDLKKLYILKGGHGIGKSTFIRKFADAFPNHNRDFLVCAGDPKSLDGVIIKFPFERQSGVREARRGGTEGDGVVETYNIAIIDGTHPHPVDPIYPGIIDEIINLGEFINPTKVTATKKTLKDLKSAKADHYKRAYSHLNSARGIHHKLESFYKDAVDFEAIQKVLMQIIESHRIQQDANAAY